MLCINCLHGKTHIYNSRPRNKDAGVWRRHSCKECGFTFTTSEAVDLSTIYKVSANPDQPRATQPFSAARLTLSLLEVLDYATQSSDDAYWLAQTVQTKIIETIRPKQRLTTEHIAEICFEILEKYNQVAALAYAARHNLPVRPKRRPGRPSKIRSNLS